MTTKSLLYIVTKSPYSSAVGQEALDAALIGASFDHKVSLLFIHDGVFQLKSNQDTSGTQLKQFTKAYSALEDFGIEQILCHDLAMLARGMRQDHLMRAVTVASTEQVRTMIAESDRVFTF